MKSLKSDLWTVGPLYGILLFLYADGRIAAGGLKVGTYDWLDKEARED